MGRRRVHRPDAGSEPVLMQNNLPPLCDAERRFFVCSSAHRPGYRFPGSGGSDALSSLSGGVPPSGFSGGVPPVMVMEPLESKPALQQYLFEQHAARNLKTSIISAVRTAARSISRTAAGSSVASPAPSRSCAWLPRLRQTKKPSPISRPGKPSCRSERSA